MDERTRERYAEEAIIIRFMDFEEKIREQFDELIDIMALCQPNSKEEKLYKELYPEAVKIMELAEKLKKKHANETTKMYNDIRKYNTKTPARMAMLGDFSRLGSAELRIMDDMHTETILLSDEAVANLKRDINLHEQLRKAGIVNNTKRRKST